MNKMARWTLAIIAIPSVLMACSNESGNTSKDSVPIVKNTAPVELTIVGVDAEDALDHILPPVRKKFPNYTIKYIQTAKGSTVPELITAGTKFDIIYNAIGSFEMNLLDYNLQYDMTDMIKSRKIDLNLYEKSTIDHIKTVSGGKIYGLPSSNNQWLIYYNKTLFNNFGVAYPKDGMTWDEAFALANKMTRIDGGKQYFGLGYASVSSILTLNQFSLSMVDAKTELPTINKDERWGGFFRSLFMDGTQMAASKSANILPARNEFYKEKSLGMLVYSASYPIALRPDLEDMDWDMVALPTFKEKPGIGSSGTPTYWGVTSLSSQKEAAMDVVQFLSSEPFLLGLSKIGRFVSVETDEIKKVFATEAYFKNKNYKAIYYNKLAPMPSRPPYINAVAAVYNKHATSVLKGSLDLNTAFRMIEEESLQEIAKYKAK